MSVLGIHLLSVYQLALLSEAAFGFSELFLKTQHVCPFHDSWFMSSPAQTTLSVQQFLTKNATTPMPLLPYSPFLILIDFSFVSPDEQSPQREMFCRCGRGETQSCRSTKKASKSVSPKLFEQWKKSSVGVLHHMESTLKVTKV